MVGQGEGGLLEARRRGDEVLHLRRAVEQAVVAVDVGVDEGRGQGTRSVAKGSGV